MYFADDIFKCIFLDENYCILIQISLKCVPNDLIDDKTALVQIGGLVQDCSNSFAIALELLQSCTKQSR